MTDMIKLFQIAKSRAVLTDDELKDLSDYDANFQLETLTGVISAIGCLVSADEHAGNFQNANEVPDLLWLIASTVRDIQAKLYVSQEAELLLQERNETKTTEPARMVATAKVIGARMREARELTNKPASKKGDQS